jgi:hypothetical protein
MIGPFSAPGIPAPEIKLDQSKFGTNSPIVKVRD